LRAAPSRLTQRLNWQTCTECCSNTKRVFTALRDNGETLDTYGIREIPVVLQRTVMLREYMRDNGERVIVLEEEVCSIGELDDVSDET
jgi:hypothetical protein